MQYILLVKFSYDNNFLCSIFYCTIAGVRIIVIYYYVDMAFVS